MAVGSGKLALEVIKRNNFDGVIMDIQMPIMNGYEAVAVLRNGPPTVQWFDLPVIALTANAMSRKS